MKGSLPQERTSTGKVSGYLRATLENRLVVAIFAIMLIVFGLRYAPFDWDIPLEQDPIPVDAIPDYGENQQIVFTDWPGRSPQDVEDQITYPLTASLLGLPEVKSIRSASMSGFSSINIIFNDGVDFYWSRTRVLEKLNSLPPGTLPDGLSPQLGPDSTGLGQVFWYTLEGWSIPTTAEASSSPVGGWNLEELRSLQDWYIRPALQSVEGVSEVASIGGHVKEYQIDIDPEALRAYDLTLADVATAARDANRETGARTIEVNRVNYNVRGLGYVRNVDQLRQAVVKNVEGTPVTIDQVASVQMGPASRGGVLDKNGNEAVGGVVVIRYGENPLAVIERVKNKIEEISPGLPATTLETGESAQVRIVPFYDRTNLIQETIGTLETAMRQQILVTIVVVMLLILHLKSALIISSILPLAVLFSFIGMKMLGVDANIVALSGIAIAIGTIVDIGIVLCENVIEHLEQARKKAKETGEAYNPFQVTLNACTEVGSAVLTAVLTTVISFLPVFAMEGAEGKLFGPLAYTKTLALIGSIVVGLTLLPPLALAFIAGKPATGLIRNSVWIVMAGLIFGASLLYEFIPILLGLFALTLGLFHLMEGSIPKKWQPPVRWISSLVVAVVVSLFLALDWMPLGVEKPIANSIFVVLTVGLLISVMWAVVYFYPFILGILLNFKKTFLCAIAFIVLTGATIWLGMGTVFSFVPEGMRQNKVWAHFYHTFPGLGREFMPAFDEGSYLLMPITSPHASITEVIDQMQQMDSRVASIPEVETVVGKIGRVESPLDPAPISMFETVVNYKTEYKQDASGRILRYAYDEDTKEYLRDEKGALIPQRGGRPYRQWRDHIRNRQDIWQEIAAASTLPGVSPASELQPIETRITMLQTGMRATTGLKVFAPDLDTVQELSLRLRDLLVEIPSIEAESVLAPRIMGKPYLEVEPDRELLAQYGISVATFNDAIEAAVGGITVSQTVEGRERYNIRLRYQRERRDSIEALENVLIPTASGEHLPIGLLAQIKYRAGPDEIRSEDTFPVVYVTFETVRGVPEVEAINQAQAHLDRKIASSEFTLPAGASYQFAGNYQNQVRAEQKLALILPITLLLIFLIIYMQFRRVATTLMVFSGVFVAWSGGFILIWFFNQDWFLNVELFQTNLREVFQVHPMNLSIAIWVGFLALFGIATDDGVLMGTYLEQRFGRMKGSTLYPNVSPPASVQEIRRAVVEAAQRRVRPAMMTSATTILALLPVLTSTGKGASVMVPMAIPTFGGMLFAIITIFVVPILYCQCEEWRLRLST